MAICPVLDDGYDTTTNVSREDWRIKDGLTLGVLIQGVQRGYRDFRLGDLR